MTSLNVYTCTQAELETFHQIGATSSAKIVALRDAVIAGQRPEITVADLAEIRLTADQWQSSIVQGDLSLDFHATGHFTDISPNAKTNAEKFTFTSQSPLGKDTTQTNRTFFKHANSEHGIAIGPNDVSGSNLIGPNGSITQYSYRHAARHGHICK